MPAQRSESECGYQGSRKYSFEKLGCRCDACTAAKAAYRRRYSAEYGSPEKRTGRRAEQKRAYDQRRAAERRARVNGA